MICIYYAFAITSQCTEKIWLKIVLKSQVLIIACQITMPYVWWLVRPSTLRTIMASVNIRLIKNKQELLKTFPGNHFLQKLFRRQFLNIKSYDFFCHFNDFSTIIPLRQTLLDLIFPSLNTSLNNNINPDFDLSCFYWQANLKFSFISPKMNPLVTESFCQF